MPRSARHPVFPHKLGKPRQQYLANCVDWPRRWVSELKEMIDGENTITRRRFMDMVDRVDLAYLEGNLGYSALFPMSEDWHVTYHSGILFDHRCYYFKHSAVEFVFAPKPVREKMKCPPITCETSSPIPWKATSGSGGTHR